MINLRLIIHQFKFYEFSLTLLFYNFLSDIISDLFPLFLLSFYNVLLLYSVFEFLWYNFNKIIC